MTDTTALSDQALAAADALMAEYAPPGSPPLGASLRPLLAIAWVQGRQAGGDEARAVVERFSAEMS